MKGGGLPLKLLQTFLYAITFCCAGIILAFYSYFLSILSDRNQFIPGWMKAVEGISGVAVVYLIFAVVLTCCLGGLTFFAFVAIVLDVVFAAAFIALAVLTRGGTQNCNASFVTSPIGSGPPHASNGFGSNGFGNGQGENVTYKVSPGTACRYNKACFAVAIIGAFLFLISAVVQLWIGRHHKREKRHFTPKGHKTDAEIATANSTHPHTAPGTVGSHHTRTNGASVNPYGYDNTRNTAVNY